MSDVGAVYGLAVASLQQAVAAAFFQAIDTNWRNECDVNL